MSTTTPASSSTAVNSPESAAAAAANSNGGNSVGGLTQADFLKIMVAQFENQDPMSDSDGSGGSGTSSYVEELMSMTNITTLQTMSQQQNIELASSLPGSTVTLNNNGANVSGQVTGAAIENATLYITVNGTQYPATDLVSVNQTQAQAAAAASSTAASAASGTSGAASTTPASS